MLDDLCRPGPRRGAGVIFVSVRHRYLGEPRCDVLAVCLPMLRQGRAQLLDTVHHGRGIAPGFREPLRLRRKVAHDLVFLLAIEIAQRRASASAWCIRRRHFVHDSSAMCSLRSLMVRHGQIGNFAFTNPSLPANGHCLSLTGRNDRELVPKWNILEAHTRAALWVT